MKGYTRRHVIKTAVGAAAASPALIAAARAWALDVPFEPESGAELRMLRWKRFVQSEEEAFFALIDAFTQATGIPVRIDSEGFEDLRPKAAVAASIGSGPDIIWGIHCGRPSLSGLARRRLRTMQLPRRQIRRLVPDRGTLRSLTARREVDQRAVRHERQLHQLPRLPRPGSWFRGYSRQHGRFLDAYDKA